MLRLGRLNHAGSSPLTRGKRGDAASVAMIQRLIPAHAGKTPTRSGQSAQSAAHPRSRGENYALERRCHVGEGSSPLTRGKRVKTRDGLPLERLIPAHAGKTLVGLNSGPELGGSSPLTRGKPKSLSHSSDLERLIPAHAGKTRTRTSLTCPSRAHPRSRGENGIVRMLSWSPPGSSPLTRGKRTGLCRH